MIKFTRYAIAVSCLFLCTASDAQRRKGKTIPVDTVAPNKLLLFETLPDSSEKKSLVGILTKENIVGDTAFTWYNKNLQYFKTDSATVQHIKDKKDDVHLVLFCGTWCHDSQQLVPKYLTTLEAAGFPDKNLTIIGVDRDKKTIAQLSEAFNVTNVPTMIVMEKGKEVGRIVEYGNTALVDRELGAILAKLP